MNRSSRTDDPGGRAARFDGGDCALAELAEKARSNDQPKAAIADHDTEKLREFGEFHSGTTAFLAEGTGNRKTATPLPLSPPGAKSRKPLCRC
jgi:hypothetical protein